MTFAIVQTIEKGKPRLAVVPTQWTVPNGWNNGILDNQSEYLGKDLMFWPVNSSGENLMDEAYINANVGPNNVDCNSFRCNIKRKNLTNRSEVSLRFFYLLFLNVLHNYKETFICI